MKILIAPDKFREALDAAEVAAALAAGVRDVFPEAAIVTCPLADGGEGTGRILARAMGAQERMAAALDPRGRRRDARWWCTANGEYAIVEMAEASGLALLEPAERDPLRTTSFGTGQLLCAAASAGCRRVLLGVGGSATVDGGAGCLQALRWMFRGEEERAITEPIRGGDVGRIRAVRAPVDWPPVAIDVLCDVDNPLVGPRGAARVFAPQKGADEHAVVTLERGLTHWADVLRQACGCDIRNTPGGGAAGGIAAGLHAAAGARLRSGFDVLADHVWLDDLLAGCDLCLTGEGCIDEQTSGGKVVAGVARLAAARGVPTIAFAGAVRFGEHENIERVSTSVQNIVVITPPGTPLPVALAQTAENLRRAAREALAAWS